MSDMLLAKPDIDPRVVDLAQQIKAEQGTELEQLDGGHRMPPQRPLRPA